MTCAVLIVLSSTGHNAAVKGQPASASTQSGPILRRAPRANPPSPHLSFFCDVPRSRVTLDLTYRSDGDVDFDLFSGPKNLLRSGRFVGATQSWPREGLPPDSFTTYNYKWKGRCRLFLEIDELSWDHAYFEMSEGCPPGPPCGSFRRPTTRSSETRSPPN